MQKSYTLEDAASIGKRVILDEANALQALSSRLNDAFTQACALILNCKGKIIISGMGKSGHIAQKIAATLASTGTASFFIHPAEANHGDMGMIQHHDIVVAISYSGENEELIAILPVLRKRNVKVICITGNPKSHIARQSDITLDASITKEACPLDLAPTTSTTTALALGDALAITLLQIRGFNADDFATNHPSGLLGKQLNLTTADFCHYGDELPTVTLKATVSEAIHEMSKKKLGFTLVIDQNQHLIGIYTDGDLRRTLEQHHDIQKTTIDKVMSKRPASYDSDMLLIDAMQLMNEKRITALIIDDPTKGLCVIHMHDILAQGFKL